ncbi:hydrolase [Verrucomicrobia bacterium SCGC AG-212-E04]|nr:hydrolase [Verrucomicrobia bacterium SCGC AG-212-E04]
MQIPAGTVSLEGDLDIPEQAVGLVLFAHGSGSSRRSPRNQSVAAVLREARIGTMLFDLLTPEEEIEDANAGHLRFDLGLLSRRLMTVTRQVAAHSHAKDLPLGYFGASTGSAAALVAAEALGDLVGAVVSRGGRPDLAAQALPHIRAATLLIVGECDEEVLSLNREAFAQLRCKKEFAVVPGATHLFPERGALEQVARLASHWFLEHLKPRS